MMEDDSNVRRDHPRGISGFRLATEVSSLLFKDNHVGLRGWSASATNNNFIRIGE